MGHSRTTVCEAFGGCYGFEVIMKTARIQQVLLVLFILTMAVISVFRSYHYGPTIAEAVDGIDDWNRYARQALDIKHNGILIGSVKGPYFGPGGFLYNYFIALFFIVFGDTLAPVFLAQTILLCLSVVAIFRTFKDFLSKPTQFIFLCTLFVFATADVFVNYSHKLLAESLGLFLFSMYVYTYVMSIRLHQDRTLLLSTGFICLTTLVRPSMIPFLPLHIGLIVLYQVRRKELSWQRITQHSALIAASLMIIPMRNFIVAGEWTFLPTEGSFNSVQQLVHSSFSDLVLKLAFCLGYLPPLNPVFKIRFHWLIMWAGYFYFCYYQVRNLKTVRFREFSLHAFILIYLIVSVVFVTVQSYGYRSMLLINFVVLGFSFMGLDVLVRRVRSISKPQ